MNNDSRIGWAIIGFLVSLVFGWMVPFIWVLYVIFLLILMAQPRKPEHASPTSQTSPEILDVVGLEIAQNIESEQDPQIREGLSRALAIMREHRYPRSVLTGVAQQYDHAMPVQQPIAAVQPQTEDERRMAQEKHEQQNINTMLYVASFLIVGAAVLFIGTALDPASKFVGILIVALAFYTAGISLFKSVERLRPAAVAFVGTGLALVPFVGLAFYSYVWQNSAWAWWLTSIVGLVMFLYATLTIRQQVLSYMTLAFIFSLTTSSVSIMSVPFVWYFVIVIITGSILGLVAYKKPLWLPSELMLPMQQSGELAAPLAVVGSLFTPDRVSVFDYEMIFGVVTLHYAVAALGLGTKQRYANWTLARVFAIVFALVCTYDLSHDIRIVAWTLVVSAAITHFYSVSNSKRPYETYWQVYAQIALIVAMVAWVPDWTSVSYGLVILGAVSLWQLVVTKHELSGTGILVAAAGLPLAVIYGVMSLTHDHEVAAVIALCCASIIFAARSIFRAMPHPYVQVLVAGYWALLAESLVAAVLTGTYSWIGSIFVLGSMIVYVAAFVEQKRELHIFSNVLVACGVAGLLDTAGVPTAWVWLSTAWICGFLWYGLGWYFIDRTDEKRYDLMVGSSLTILLLAAIGSAFGDTTPAAGLTGCVAAALIAREGIRRAEGRLGYYEVAIVVATLSLQRLVAYTYPDASWVFYTHWWALSSAMIAYLRYSGGEREAAKSRSKLALGLLSVPTGLAALSDPATYQLLFLMEHLALLVAGFVVNKQFIVRWATVCVGLAVIWLLQGYTYILLSLLGLSLIGLAVWKLNKKS